MKRIQNRGNLPNHMQVFARQLTGIFTSEKETEFWEASNITEFEKNASEIGYEIIPAMDMSTNRGFLVGFDVTDSNIVSVGESYVQLKMYFVEVSGSEFKAWVKKINEHRALQQMDAALRKEQKDSTKKKLLKGDT
jgi:hypothetical protein